MSRKGVSAATAAVTQYYTHQLPITASLLSVKNIASNFCSYDKDSASTRYMIQWLRSDDARSSNSEAKITTTVSFPNLINENSETILITELII